MKDLRQAVVSAVFGFVVLSLAAGHALAQSELAVFDRAGGVVATLSERAGWASPVLSPDGTRVAARRPGDNGSELWVWDLASDELTRIASEQPGDRLGAPVWSPDGGQLAYPALRGSYFGVYRRASDGQGEEELLYEHGGGPLTLTGWSGDGRFVSFLSGSLFSQNLSEGTLYFLGPGGERPAVEIALPPVTILEARLSPDGRWLAYRSPEDGAHQIFVRAVASLSVASPDDEGEGAAESWRVSTDEAWGMIWWSQDSRALYYLTRGRELMAVDVMPDPNVGFGSPTLVSRAPDGIRLSNDPASSGSISGDGGRTVYVVPPSPTLRQITVLDREGQVVSTIGPPGLYWQPALSPDGTRVAVLREDPQTGYTDVWTFDVASGRGTPVTSDRYVENDPAWHPDGRVAYVSRRPEVDGDWGIYLRSWDGTDSEEFLYRHLPQTAALLGEFSQDGRFLTFTSGGVVLVVPLDAEDPFARKPVEFGRAEYAVYSGRFSPDSHFMAYRSDESVTVEAYVQAFDISSGAAGDGKWRISRNGADRQGISWRQDGRELYFMRTDEAESPGILVMAVEVSTSPEFQAGEPRLLFRIPGEMPRQKFVSHDGERFVFLLPAPEETTEP